MRNLHHNNKYVDQLVMTFMNTSNSISTSEARNHLHQLIGQVAQSHVPVLITGETNNAILVSQEDWDALQRTSLHEPPSVYDKNFEIHYTD
jgi:prevent-host-death family protein